MDFNNWQNVIAALQKAQSADEDMRENAREAHHFVNKKDGQWEPEIVNRMRGRPRYTDDRVNPIVNNITGTIRNADFSLRVRPAGGDASKETAKTIDGIIRNIRNISNAENIFQQSARGLVEGGVDGWEVTQDYADADSFDQDLMIKPIHNFNDRVWIDPTSYERDHSDANWGVILDYVSLDEYENQFPEGSGLSVGENRDSEVYSHKPEYVTIGKLYYKKMQSKELVLMSDGSVHEVNEDYKSVVDELAQAGITEEARRERDVPVFYVRYFDGADWLDEPTETVFNHLPIVVTYGNFAISEGKRIYRGVVEKLMDIQRVHNYSFSRNVEEVALSPRGKYWMTREQAQGNEQSLQAMNTSMSPVELYNHVDGQPTPYYQGGAPVNPGLQVLYDQTNNSINEAAGLFAANMGANPNVQSGIALENQVNQGDLGTAIWFEALEVAIVYTGKLLINAIPKVYDATRTVRTLQEDGSFEMSELNKLVLDQQTGNIVTLNDLSVGEYDVTCEIGPAYKSQQKESAETFVKIAQVYPEIFGLAGDAFLRNINSPGFDAVADRARAQAIANGLIPQEQLTEEELAAVQQQQASQQQVPDPNMVIAEAEMTKAQADMLAQQNKQQELQLKAIDLQQRYQAQNDKLQSETALNIAKVEQGQQKLDQDAATAEMQAMNQQMQLMMQQQAQMMQQQQAVIDMQNTQADTLKKLREGYGIDAVVSPAAAVAIQGQTQQIIEGQNEGMD